MNKDGLSIIIKPLNKSVS